MATLSGRTVAILVADGFDQSEMMRPRQALEDAGATVHLVSPVEGTVKGWIKGNWADEFAVDVQLDAADASTYDALVLPGGTINPDRLRRVPEAVQFVRDIYAAGKPVASICHGPWMLVEADVLRGRTATSFFSIKTDLKNAGANWVDQEVVVDDGIITSRNPDDLDAFNTAMIEEFARPPRAR
jgi:protease I